MIQKHSIITVVFGLLFLSCSPDEHQNDSYLKADYRVDLGFFKDLTINTDGNAYTLAVIPALNGEELELKSITPQGNATSLYKHDAYFLSHPKITHDHLGKLYWTADNLDGAIYSFYSNYVPFTAYTLQGAEQMNVRMNELSHLNQGNFAIYDSNLRKFKLYAQNLNTDFIIAGSDTYAVTDGMGPQASFMSISRINTQNNAIYALDTQRYIRKIDCNTSDYQVSTIYDLYQDVVIDFAIAANGDLYALVQNKGLYKLSGGTSHVYKSGIEKIKTTNNDELTTIDWSALNKIYISGDDLYLVSGSGTLTKISNFTEKL